MRKETLIMPPKAAATSHHCVNASLSDPHLGGILLGLELNDGLITPNTEMFLCCAGEGSYFDPKTNSVVTCKIKRRIGRVQDLLDQYFGAWGDRKSAPPFKMSSRSSLEVLGAIDAMLTAPSAQAMMLGGAKEKPGMIWAYAVALAYRFDIDVRVVRFERGAISALCSGQPPQAVLIEHVDKLWDPDLALEFDGLITYVYQAAMPCWIEFISTTPVTTADAKDQPQTTVKAQLSHRIEQLKLRSPMTYISPATLSKLKEMGV